MYRRRGVVLWRFRDDQGALDDIERALAMKPDWPRALTDRGQALTRLGRTEEAGELYRCAGDRSRFRAGLHRFGLRSTTSITTEKQRSESIRAPRTSIQATPNRWSGAQCTNYELGRPIEALHDLDKVIALDQKKLESVRTMIGDDWNMTFPSSFKSSGRVLEKLGRFDEAIQTYRVVLEDHPETVRCISCIEPRFC